jgi:hypothetical protein
MITQRKEALLSTERILEERRQFSDNYSLNYKCEDSVKGVDIAPRLGYSIIKEREKER